jgi:hypothetical protein
MSGQHKYGANLNLAAGRRLSPRLPVREPHPCLLREPSNCEACEGAAPGYRGSAAEQCARGRGLQSSCPPFSLMARVGRNRLESNRRVSLPSSGTHWCDMVDHRQVRDDPVKRLNQNRHLVRGEAPGSAAALRFRRRLGAFAEAVVANRLIAWGGSLGAVGYPPPGIQKSQKPKFPHKMYGVAPQATLNPTP